MNASEGIILKARVARLQEVEHTLASVEQVAHRQNQVILQLRRLLDSVKSSHRALLDDEAGNCWTELESLKDLADEIEGLI